MLCEIVLQITVSQFTGSRQTQYYTTPISSLWGPCFLCEIASVKGEIQMFRKSYQLASMLLWFLFSKITLLGLGSEHQTDAVYGTETSAVQQEG